MADFDNKTPENRKSQSKPDESAGHTLSVFAQSLAYSGVEAPTRAVAQGVDHFFGTRYDENVQHKFANAGIQRPQAEAFGSSAWVAQQLGSAIGMVAPMKLSRLTMAGRADRAFSEAARLEEGLAARLQKQTIIDRAVREVGVSTQTGLFYGAVLTPAETKNKDESNTQFFLERFSQGAKTATTFGIMGGTSAATSGLLGKAAGAIESQVIPSALKAPMQTVLNSSIVHGVIGGLPGGAVQAQLNAMESGKRFASFQDIKENVVGMTIAGGAMGGAQLFGEPIRESKPPSLPAQSKALSQNALPFHFTSSVEALHPSSNSWNSAIPEQVHSFDIDYGRHQKHGSQSMLINT